MEKFKINPTQRAFFLFVTVVIFLGIWLTGFNVVHWLLYFPPVVMGFAAVTGICPGLGFMRMVIPEK